MKNFYLLLMLLLSSCLQAITVAGTVADFAGEPLPQVVVSDGTSAVLSNNQGSFKINTQQDSLLFHRLGYADTLLAVSQIKDRQAVRLRNLPVVMQPYRVSRKGDSWLPKQALKAVVKVQSGQTVAQAVAATVASPGGELAGERAAISIAGNRSRHTLVLLDGIPLNKPGQEFDLSSLDADTIEQVEVLRGGASALGGSGAVGGVVNLVSRTYAGLNSKVQLNSEFGSFGHYKNGVNVVLSRKDKRIDFATTFTQANNDFRYYNMLSNQRQTRKNNHYRQQRTSLGFYQNWGDFNLQYKTSLEQTKKGLPGPLNSLAKFDKAHFDSNDFTQDIRLEWLGMLEHKFTMFLSNQRSVFDNLESSLPAWRWRGVTTNQRLNADWKSQWQNDLWSLMANCGHQRDEFFYHQGSAITDVEPVVRHSTYLRLRQQWQQDFNPLTATVRLYQGLDTAKDNTAGSSKQFFSWRAESTLKHGQNYSLELGGVAARSFALPGFYDLYYKGDMQATGNPDLKPEKAYFYQVSLNSSCPIANLKTTLNHSSITDMVFWYQSATGWKPGNVLGATLDNLELELNLTPWGWLQLQGRWLRTIAKDDSGGEFDGKTLTYTPASQIHTALILTYKQAKLQASYQRTGPRWPTRDNMWGSLPVYETCNLAVSNNWQISVIKLSANAKVNNIFDKAYQVYPLTPRPGLNWGAGLNIQITI